MFLANFLIALREGVEAALVVGIIAAYLIKSGHREALTKMWVGVAVAAALPLALGAVLTWGPKTLTFQAQEVIGGVLSLLAAGLVTWMIFWMASHARHIKGELEGQLSTSLDKDTTGRGVVWIAVLAVGREGLETALFIWATVRSAVQAETALTVVGVVSGLAVAVVIGYVVYRGAVRVNLRRFFVVTGALLVLVAAGIVAYGVGDLQEAGVLPGIMQHAWDLSGYLPAQTSPVHWVYVLAQAMFQANLQPTVLQVIAWWLYLVPTLVFFARQSRQSRPAAATPKEYATS
ncbi:FTR1 family protein [Phycicoccus endophyticus]|uniref:FTR1 family protein n=1 Tax=Phycicoccus endophyticus TaxID=1690220 RepID=A0A7G9R193_9MICO|nr:iron uptake transporter permease EfeU [Phycicoccus endophyticus]NHI18860.1 iron transporter [Phycicoccus endophyticus]QNN49368.1 FTR1 family protein [Phycicoccus endophyticus]GGL35967.1 iron transporter [Phycicoccus endophyticus]